MSAIIMYTLLITVTYHGKPLSNQDVLLFHEQKYLTSVKTDNEGKIEYNITENIKGITALVRIKTDQLVTCLLFEPGKDNNSHHLKIEELQKFEEVTFQSKNLKVRQNYELFIDPISIRGLSSAYLDYFHFVSEGVKSSYFYKATFTKGEVKLMLPKGCFRVGGIANDPDHMALGGVPSKIVAAATINEKPVEIGNRYIGFEINTSKTKQVTLHWEDYTE